MPVEGALVLPADIQMVPVRELPAEVRARLGDHDGAIAIARPLNRAGAKLIDAPSAEFLRTFASPHTVVDAVLAFAATRHVDPVPLFDRVYPLLERMVAAGFLVQAGSVDEGPRQASFTRGEMLGGWRVSALVHLAEDVEVYQVRRARAVAALKIARTVAPATRALFDTERRVLEHLGGRIGPALLDSGSLGDRPYLVSRWVHGVDAERAAHDLRMLPRTERRARLSALCAAIAEAYARLHERGVVHGDVHARNVRVDAAGAVTLIDFGWSVLRGDPTAPRPAGRAGAGFLFEPELARAALAHRRAPTATFRGEQFLVAALLDALWVGAPYLRLSLDWDRALRQIATRRPMTFRARHAPSEPELERVLRRALAKYPAKRVPTMRHLATHLATFAGSAGGVASPPQASPARRPDFARAADRIMGALGFVGDDRRTAAMRPPRASVACGAAGVAYAFYRLSVVRSDGLMLANADLWIERARAAMSHAGAFTGDDLGLSAERVGDVSLVHAAPGVHVVHALVAAARGDGRGQREATVAFVAASRRRTTRRDLTHGRAGLLLGCAAIAESYAPAPMPRGVRTAADALERKLWRSLAQETPVGAPGGTMDLGMAHGWSGVLFSLLRWSEATQRPPSARLVRRLGELAACAEPFGRGVRWRWLVPAMPEGPPEPYVAGWCNGVAGLVQLWCLASRLVPGRRYRDLAVGSAWHAWESEVEAGPFVCCGLAGRAFALAAVARLTGDASWWRRARSLAAEAGRRAREHLVPTGEDRPDSLYFGALGVAVLLAELAQPGPGGMPLLGPYA